MRRILLILAAAAALVAFAAASAIGDGEGEGGEDGYLVRAYFDNAGFLVNGEDVRVAGAKVGSIADVDVTRPGEPVTEDGSEDPGKAVVVLRIEDAGFQNFLSDASCLIRPQSLLGEKYVDCQSTQPRAPGSEPPPSLEQIPDGEIGEGQFRLPLENNGKQVDLDLINNITRQSETDRFRLILNDLGAGVAARGEVLEDVIRRADPALRETDEVLAQLADQNKELAQLAADSDVILAPLAREREHLSGFIRNATIAGEASAERRDDIVLGFQRFPEALEQLQLTMVELRRFAEEATPVATDLRIAAPGFTGATEALAPFSKAGTGALLSLGRATEAAGPDLAASDSVIRDLRKLATTATPGNKALRSILATLRKTNGIKSLMDFFLNTSNTFNGFDEFGHYLRAQILITNCVEYEVAVTTGCNAGFVPKGELSAPATQEGSLSREVLRGENLPGVEDGDWNADGVVDETDAILAPDGFDDGDDPSFDPASTSSGETGLPDLLNFLTGDRSMRRRQGSPLNAAFRNPTVIGAITVLVSVLTVFLAYNANTGLPFVKSYRLTAQVPNAAALVPGNEVRIGGVRVGIVEAIQPIAHENGRQTANLDLKLDKSVEPLPVDSKVIIRSRSALGLKFVQITRGTSDEGFKAGSLLPLAAATPEPVEIDEFFSTFDEPTRQAIRSNLYEFGNALAGRGPALNEAIGGLQPLLPRLTRVMRVLGDEQRGIGTFFRALEQSAAEVAPVAEVQAQMFVVLDTTLQAFADVARPFLQETITKGAATLLTTSETLPRIRPFLANSAGLFKDLQPGAAALAVSADTIESALLAGIPALRESPTLNNQLPPTAASLRGFNDDPAVRTGIDSLTDFSASLTPTLRFIGPAQSTCNYLTILLHNFSNAGRLGNATGNWQRANAQSTPSGPNNEGSPASAPANGGGTDPRNFLHVNPYPNTAAPGQPFECEAGNEPYAIGEQSIGNIPGNQGINTARQIPSQNPAVAKPPAEEEG